MSDQAADQAQRVRSLRIDREPAAHSPSHKAWWILLVVLIVALVSGGWWWWQQRSVFTVSVAVAQPVSAEVATAPDSVLDASGYVVARRQATVSSKTTGKVEEVLIEEGQRVEAGQVMARLDDVNLRRQLGLATAQVAAAESALAEIRVQLAQARRDLERQQELSDRGLVSEDAVEQAQLQVESLQARLAARRNDIIVSQRNVDLIDQQLEDAVIRAPFAGVVIAKAAQPGEMISPISAGGGFTRTGIGTIVDMESLEVEVDVNEAYIQRVEAGQQVTATLDAYPDWTIPAQVIAIVPTADRQKATVKVRIDLLDKDSRVLPDMGVKVSFLENRDPASSSNQPALSPGVSIPATALNAANRIFAVDAGVVESRAVQVASKRGERAIISAGLTAGERVVASIPPGLEDGMEVRTKPN